MERFEASGGLLEPYSPATGDDPSVRTFSLRDYPLATRAEVEGLLVPRYLESIPWESFWGGEFEVRMPLPLSEHLRDRHLFMIRSTGSDRRFDSESYEVAPFLWEDTATDIVWADGYFVNWPAIRSDIERWHSERRGEASEDH